MQTAYRRIGVVVGFTLLLSLLVVNALLTGRKLDVQVSNALWAIHSQEVILELTETESLIKDAETGQRGFLYTGVADYLAPYEVAVRQVRTHIDGLAELTKDNPRQQPRILELRQLSNAKLGELAETIELYRSGHPDRAKALVESGQGLSLMDGIRRVDAEMRAEEDSLAAARSANYQRSIRFTRLSLVLATCAAGLGLLLLAYYILREANLRERHNRLSDQREEWFRSTLTSLGDGVIATDSEGKITFLNPIAEQLMRTGLAHVRGRPIDSVFKLLNETTRVAVENPIRKVLELGHVVGLANHTVLERTDGTFIAIEDSAAPIRDGDGRIAGVVMVFRDATVERRTNELMRKTEKLAAAARIAATVAHEINNPLEAIGNLLYLVKGIEGIPRSAVEQLLLAEFELERVSHITRQTLGFYRESKEPDQVPLESLVESVLRIHDNKLKTKNIVVEREYGECPAVNGLDGELKQVVANLISNAADAVGHGGTIWVNLTCVDCDGGKAVRLNIRDDGPGISPDLGERIFEPFFTTKKDVGTGLGLWVSREIVSRHGGTIELSPGSEHGFEGASFEVLLPLASGTFDTRVSQA